MKWTDEAEAAVKKVPFFVRKKVKARVEEEARERGLDTITLREVNRTRARFLNKMEEEVTGYQVEACFGDGGCPRKANGSRGLQQRVGQLLAEEDILGFLKSQVDGKLKFHHEFRVAFADCPNACSQPQIRDICIIGAVIPETTEALCSECGACADACAEEAISFKGGLPSIEWEKCLVCGRCIRACETGTLSGEKKGYRVLLGGRLGRHPRLAMELPGIYDEDAVFDIVSHCVSTYKARSKKGERFSHLFNEEDYKEVAALFLPRSIVDENSKKGRVQNV
ncbi:MAG: 4Fe-4S binding protein [Desulfobacterales bacterium]|nr:4Fe-4S binding protein [Desulfobacterales bacterium]